MVNLQQKEARALCTLRKRRRGRVTVRIRYIPGGPSSGKTMNVGEIGVYGGTKEIIEALSSAGLKELYPPQALAVEAGLLEDRESFVISAPTASGKTLVAEMAALKVYFEKKGKVLYTVPLRALAREKYDDFARKYRTTGLKVALSSGDYDSAAPWLGEADVIIATNEKVDSLFRHRAPWLRDVRLVIADEVHLMGDSGRGPTLEIVLTRIRVENPGIRIIALSATIPNAEEIAAWLSARLIRSDWRPVPLREGVYYGDAVIFNDGTVTWIEKKSPDDAVNLAMDTVKEGGQALVFVSTRKAAESVAQKAASRIAAFQSKDEKEAVKKASKEMSDASPEPTRLGARIAEFSAQGVAFHHAGLLSAQRRLIEYAFRANKLKLIAATTTLAMGLNLPSRRVIIRDWRRYESEQGMRPLPVLEIKQMAGRAGRPGFDPYGEAVLIARNKREERYVFENYIKGEPENITSQLANESILRTHVLALIAGGFATARDEISEFFGRTFFAYREGLSRLTSMTGEIAAFLLREDLVREHNGLSATRFGRRVSELYIDPLTAVILRDALRSQQEISSFALLHLITRTPDMLVLQVKKNDVDRLMEIYSANVNDLLLGEAERHPSEELLGQLKTAWLLSEWVDEAAEEAVTDRFGIGPGDLHGIVELTDWLLYAASELAGIFSLAGQKKKISPLRLRVVYGVKEELLPLVALRGIGRVRARNLFDRGYKTPAAIGDAEVEALEKVPSIGRAVAEDIKKQVEASRAAA